VVAAVVVHLLVVVVVVELCKPQLNWLQQRIQSLLALVAQVVQAVEAIKAATTVHLADLPALQQAAVVVDHNRTPMAVTVGAAVGAVTVFQLAVWVFHCKAQMAVTAQAV
jgi:hypothetical protein